MPVRIGNYDLQIRGLSIKWRWLSINRHLHPLLEHYLRFKLKMPSTDKKFHNLMTLEIAAKFIASPLAPRTFVNQSSVYSLQSSVCSIQSPAISTCSLQSQNGLKCQMAHELRTQLEIRGKRWNLHQMLTKNAAAGNHLTFSMAKTLVCWPSYLTKVK